MHLIDLHQNTIVSLCLTVYENMEAQCANTSLYIISKWCTSNRFGIYVNQIIVNFI